MRRLRWLFGLMIIIQLFATELLLANKREQGQEALRRGDLEQARQLFLHSLRDARQRPDERVMIYQALGITEFYLGNRAVSQKYFRRALTEDPNRRLPRRYQNDRNLRKDYAAARQQVMTSLQTGPKPSAVSRPSSVSPHQARGAPLPDQYDSSQTSLFLDLAPFGIGQYAQGKNRLGTAIASVQLIGIGLFIERRLAAKQAISQGVIIQSDFEGGARDIADDEFVRFQRDNQIYIERANLLANIGLLSFIGAYAYGIVDALYFPPPTVSRRRLALSPHESLDHHYSAPIDLSARWRFELALDIRGLDQHQPGIIWTWRWNLD